MDCCTLKTDKGTHFCRFWRKNVSLHRRCADVSGGLRGGGSLRPVIPSGERPDEVEGGKKDAACTCHI